MELIKIGTLVSGSVTFNNLQQLVKHGFESFSLPGDWNIAHGMDIKSKEGEGTRVTLKLPKIME